MTKTNSLLVVLLLAVVDEGMCGNMPDADRQNKHSEPIKVDLGDRIWKVDLDDQPIAIRIDEPLFAPQYAFFEGKFEADDKGTTGLLKEVRDDSLVVHMAKLTNSASASYKIQGISCNLKRIASDGLGKKLAIKIQVRTSHGNFNLYSSPPDFTFFELDHLAETTNITVSGTDVIQLRGRAIDIGRRDTVVQCGFSFQPI